MFWLGDGLSTAANMLTSKGYAAGGVQTGFAFGFMGIGLSYSLPGYSMYGFIGYALLATTAAEYVEHYPPNSVPEISDITPADGQQNVPVILSELQFRIQDADGDLMSYSVTTDPDIGSRSGNLKPFGVYTVPISGLKVNSMYKWTVEVTDGKDTTIQEFSFETPVAPFNPFDEGWQYRKQISINHSQVAGDLSNFPIFIHSIDADLSAKAQPGGDDILFMDGIGVAYKLFHEIESYKASNGELLAWVNIPNLNADENTTIYMYYGNPESGNAQMPERVWDPYFAVVWHLKESSGEIHDSTNRVSGGTIDGAQLVSGKMGSALEFLDHDSVKGISSSFDDSITDAFTVTAWVKWYGPCTYPHDQIIFDGRSSLTNGFVFFIQHDTGLLKMYLMRANTVIYSESPIPVGVWTFVVGVFNDDTNTMRLYINGGENGTITTTQQYLDSSESAMIGNNHWASSDGQWAPTNGVIDELRIVQTERTADWLVTEYNNQNDPFDFLTFGSEEGQP
jgi:hypothetical protein